MDRAMGQLETMPGGFNALRQMYEQMAPLEEAAHAEEANPFAALLGGAGGGGGAGGADGPLPWASGGGAADAAANPFAALMGGGGAGVGGGAPSLDSMESMVRDPMFRSMMEMMRENPAFLQQVRGGERCLALGMFFSSALCGPYFVHVCINI